MTSSLSAPLLLFYPTSPVHVRDVKLLLQKLSGWRCTAIVYEPLAFVAPGIATALSQEEINTIAIGEESELENQLPSDAKILAIGAAFEPFALDLFAWAKLQDLPVIAIQEVAQLALNQLDINNYDAPFDRIFVASPDERRLFLSLGYPDHMLKVSGLLANDRFHTDQSSQVSELLWRIGILDDRKPIVYTTSPLRGRLSLHNKDNAYFRETVLTQIAIASRKTGRKSVIKLHPNEDIGTAQTLIRKYIPDAIVLDRHVNVDELFPIIGVLVNRGNSQTCLEAVIRGIPTVVPACGLKTLFHEDGGAYLVDDLSRLSDAIERAFIEAPTDASRVKAKHFFVPPRGVANFIAKEIFNLASKPQPPSEDSWNRLIKTTLFVGRHDRALQLCERIGSRTSWQDRVKVALKAHAEGRLNETIAAWHQCAALDRDWFFPHYELAHGFQAAKQFDKAIEQAHKAIELHPPFHSLWHEIPMRVVIMASYRQIGDVSQAASELKRMEEPGLLEIVPELLIEKAAQISTADDQLDNAEKYLEQAFSQIVNFPVNKKADVHLLERAALQYLEVANRYYSTGNLARSLVCLSRIVTMLSDIHPTSEPISIRLFELGQQWENDKNFHGAEKCYKLAAEKYPADHKAKYTLARIALKQGKLYSAIGELRRLVEIPDAAKQVVVRMLSPRGAARLLRYWPTTSRSIQRPTKLSAYALAWALQKTVRSRFQDFFETTTTLLMIWMFVAWHFYGGLSANPSSIRRGYRALRVRFLRKFYSSTS